MQNLDGSVRNRVFILRTRVDTTTLDFLELQPLETGGNEWSPVNDSWANQR
jgi:hypothetical protein